MVLRLMTLVIQIQGKTEETLLHGDGTALTVLCVCSPNQYHPKGTHLLGCKPAPLPPPCQVL